MLLLGMIYLADNQLKGLVDSAGRGRAMTHIVEVKAHCIFLLPSRLARKHSFLVCVLTWQCSSWQRNHVVGRGRELCVYTVRFQKGPLKGGDVSETVATWGHVTLLL